ncbi:MAG: hypothetical protein Q8O57_03755, partial [Kiritimatiellota bacterium]|nr:hypothetical protein [Kiritimatiellota bacterium]
MAIKKAPTPEPEPTANLPQLNLLQVQPYGPGFNYWQLHVTITGITPLLMNNPASMWEPKVILAGSRGKNIPTPEEEAKRGLYVLENDELYFPGLGLRNCVLDGTSRGNFKINKKPLKVPLASALIIPNERLPLTRAGMPFGAVRDAANGYTIDRRRAVIQGQGIIRSRPRLAEGWQ